MTPARARAYLLALVRFGDARVRDDFGRVNFARGQVGHLVALGEASLQRGETRLTRRRRLGVNPARVFGFYLSQNFSAAVALARDGVGDDPGHLRGRAALVRPLPAGLAGPLRRLTHVAWVRLLRSDTSVYVHLLRCLVSHTGMQPERRAGEPLYAP